MTRNHDSISRTFARWTAGLTFEDLSADVIDKVKAVTLMALVGGLIGASDPRARALADLVSAEDSKSDGATILGSAAKVTRTAAVMVNAHIMHIAGLYDSYRMLIHPGPVLVSAGLTNAELGNKNGKAFMAALAAGYECECRVAHDFVPAIAARGFRPSPVVSTLGAAIVACRLMDLDEDAVAVAITVAANMSAGLFESGRVGGGEMSLHEPNAAQQGTLAAVLASLRQFRASEEIIEGASGFYRAFAGRIGPTLSHVFTGSREIDLGTVTHELGSTYRFLDVMFRMYSIPGYNQPVIDAIAELRRHHSLDPDQVEEIVVAMNYLETLYPSPEFPRHADAMVAQPGTTRYFAAHTAVHGGYPVAGMHQALDSSADGDVAAMMDRVSVQGIFGHPMFSPRVLIRTKDGRAHTSEYLYTRMAWRFDRLAAELRRCVDGIPGGQAKLDEAVSMIRALDELETVKPLLALAGSQ